MATNMIELMAMLREHNRASSSFTSPPEHRTTVDPNLVVPPIHVTDSEDLSFSATVYAPTVHLISDPLPPPPPPIAISLPPVAFLSADSAIHALPPLTLPMRPPIYTVLPPTVPPVINAQAPVSTMDQLPFQAPQPEISFSYPAPPPLNIPPTELGTPTQAAPPAPLINFLIRAKCSDTRTTRNLSFRPSKMISVDYTPALQTSQAYAHPLHYTQLYLAQQAYSLAIPIVIQSSPLQQYAPSQVQQSRTPASRPPQPTQRAPTSQVQQGGVAQPRQHKQYTPLPAPPSHIFQRLLAGNKIKTEAPGPNFDPTVQNQNLRCEFHQGAPGHTLDTCWRLRDKIQEMINMKQISFNEAKLPNVRVNPLPDLGLGPEPSINMISIAAIGEEEDVQDHQVPWNYGGEVVNMEQEMNAMGITRSGRVYQGPEPADKGKAPATAFSIVPEATPLPTKKVTEQEAETFMKVIKTSEYKVVEQMGKSPAHISLLALLLSFEPHRDALLKDLIAAQIPKETTPDRIEETMNVNMSHIRASKTTVRAFDGSKRVVNREIDLLIDVGPCSFSVTFQILEIPNAFNILLGRPWIYAAGAVPSSLHQKLKFFVEGKLITVNGEEDYAVYKETAIPYISIGEDQNLPFHSFDTIFVILDYGEVGPSRTDHMIGKVEERLRPRNWTQGTLQSNPSHRYNDLNSSEIHLGKSLPICFEEGLDEDGHVPEIDESLHRLEDHQLTSIEPTEEINIGTVEEPHTLMIGTDNTARHTQFSFMDGFSGYNQIQMDEEHKIKTTFIMMWGTFCYKVMPFGLKNAEAIYQRAMVTLFHDMMHKEIEVYVNNMIAKSKEGEDHLVNLKRLFDRLKKYKLRLNPAKCTFGVKSEKLLGFVVNQKGIEVDPDKVKAIMELPPLSTVREVRSFLGRLNYIVRFIANLTDKCQPLFRLLHKNAAVEWDDECQKAFDIVKAYLVQPPMLVPPSPDRPFILYLTIRRQSIGCMLGQKDDSTHAEREIYYLSKKFTEGESNYPEIEKMCCALVWVMQRLQQYTLCHIVRLMSKTDPLKYLLGSPSSMKNIAKWRC
ncbi:hypothetical protein CRG98_032043 [Punica granatum]|uniref:Reverse transcriptase domain-containing protein n=1 Tax=Punica granatum TaxID=22663 RepID=A0A2I0IU91_PUNGR|nr:hypothetical protein CRG98_032043 [Punica granatum]